MRIRITALTVILLLLFGVILAQAVFVQVHRAGALDSSPGNPRVLANEWMHPRGEILSSNGTVLARSIPVPGSSLYKYRRSYPLGSLTSDVVGWVSTNYGNWGLEGEYANYLVNHAQPAQSASQVWDPQQGSDTLVTTLQLPLQQVAARALAGRDGAVVALDPRDGDVLALYSNPTYNPAPMTSIDPVQQQRQWQKIATRKDAIGFYPLSTLALQYTFPPGSTFKVVTTSAILRYDPALATEKVPYVECLNLAPYGSPGQCLQNSSFSPCGGTIAVMLPASCDPGYALLGIQLGAQFLYDEATEFGFNAIPPIDLPQGEVKPAHFPPVADYVNGLPFLAYSAIGQWNVGATALQDALVASGIADGGKVMVPHLMKEILSPDGTVVTKYKPKLWRKPLGPVEAETVNGLMQAVVTHGTASAVGFLYQDDVAAKTGTAQTGAAVHLTDDWMIAFAPASDPVVAVAVVLPEQPVYDWGATIAGPVMKCVIEGELAIVAHQPAANTATTCPS